MARKKHGDEGGGYSWMDTYGDMVTLLLTFFVMLFSMSTVNAEKWEMLVKSFQSVGGNSDQIVLSPEGTGNDFAENRGDAGPDATAEKVNLETMLPENFDQLFEYLKTYVEQNGMQSSVSVQKNGDSSVYIRFADNIFFQPDSAVLLPDKTGILEFLGKCLTNLEDQIRITRIDGHTADPKIENYNVSDRTLSTDRANSVLLYFEEIAGVDPHKLMSSGYGKNYPIADNNTPEGREKNRRVEMMILSNSDSGMTVEELYAMIDPRIMTDVFDDKYNSEDIVIPQTSSQPEEEQQEASTPESSAPEEAPASEVTLPMEPPPAASSTGQLIPPPQPQ
ncbi:MAG: flagellar motor protein MotB [Angelakisella sp.]